MADAYLNGIALDCETIDDGFRKSLAVNEFPYRDRAVIGDMGLEAVRIRLRCYFLADRYEAHRALLEQLKNGKRFELDHPEYGLMSGAVQSVSVRRDERKRTAEIDLEFVEGDAEIEAAPVADVAAGAESHFATGLSSAADDFAGAATAALNADAASILGVELDQDQGILSQFTGLSRTARDYVRRIDTVEAHFAQTLNDVALPANALISTIEFGRNLPGRLLGAVARCAARYSTLLATTRTAPARFIQSLNDGFVELDAALWIAPISGADSHARSMFYAAAALETGVQLGSLFGADQDRRTAQQQAESEPGFDISGQYLRSASAEAVMNVREIETTLATVRGLIDTAVDLSRSNDSLKQMAELLLRHATQIKLVREQIVRIALANATPLHLVCLHNGLSYRAAERIMAINAIARPNFTSGSIDIYGR
ncbi:MAG: DNA circularization N-terminal domain-containing protein [Desulfobacterales bacterium]|nr:DNA circularization N-terminal domain-containing protein [Desulfobacterales bacterium]